MKFKLVLIFIIFSSCAQYSTGLDNKTPYNSKGFAYIFNNEDYDSKLIKRKLDNNKLQISHNKIRTNSLIKIINPKTQDYIVLKNLKKINYPDFYKIMITDAVANKLNIDPKIPLVEVLEIKKNKSFVAKKAKIYNEEKKISSNAPVTSVKISNISKNAKNKKIKKKDTFSILIATFYSKDIAIFLKDRIIKEIPKYDANKLKIQKKRSKEINLISGPYNTINLMKNDYILLQNFGFEELDISINE